jgi:hypothetical protein
MKMLLCHSNRDLLPRLLRRPGAEGHVVILCLDPSLLIPMVGEIEPHLVLLGAKGLPVPPETLMTGLREIGFYARVLQVPEDLETDQQLDAVWRALGASSRDHHAVDYDPQHYTVVSETEHPTTASKPFPASCFDLPTQENRLLALLEAGTTQHVRAQSYLQAASATHESYEKEWTLAVLCGDMMAYLWRSQLFRYLSALVHYIPGVETECLPLPHPPARRLDCLHSTLSVEALYALSAAQSFGLNPHIACGLANVGQLGNHNGPPLGALAVRLTGWTLLLREAAHANAQVLDACLSAQPADLRALRQDRSHRNLQRLFCAWWGLGEFGDSPEPLERTAREFRQGRRAMGIPAFCSFSKFSARREVPKTRRFHGN